MSKSRIRHKNSLVSCLVMVLFVLSTLFAPTPVDANTVEIKILSINDFHGALLEKDKTPGAAKLATFILNERALNPKGTLLLSAGDMFQGSVRSNILYGQPVVEMMNNLNFNAMALGNHEFDWGVDVMRKLAKSSSFPWLAANVIENYTNKPLPFTLPYVITKANGINVGIIGLTTPETAYTSSMNVVSNFKFIEPKDILDQTIDDVKKAGAQVVIVVSHLGSSPGATITGEVVAITAQNNKPDAIISGHTHENVAGKVNGIPIVQALTRGHYVGEIKLLYSTTENKVIDSTVQTLLVNPKNLQPNKTMEKIVARSAKKAHAIEQNVLAEAVKPIPHDRHTFSVLGELFTDFVRKDLGTDIAFINGGGLRRSLAQGKVTLGDMYDISPFDNTIVTMDITGKELFSVLEYGIANKTYGYIQFSGLKVEFDASQPVGEKIIKASLINGEPIDMDKRYSIAVPDFMADGGDGYTIFKKGENIVNSNKVLREIFANSIKNLKKLNIDSDGRLIEVSQSAKKAA